MELNTFVLIDIYNIFYRAMYTTSASEAEREGLLLHKIFNMINKACDKFKPTHVIVCADGKGTWRKSLYPSYKANRLEKLQDKLPAQVLIEEQLKNLFQERLLPLLSEKTNMSVLQYPNAEADDLIARFCHHHSNDFKIIVSTDTDFLQLVNDKTFIYNTLDERIITPIGICTADAKKTYRFSIKAGKVSIPKQDTFIKKGEPCVPMADWIEYTLFSKCVRGDSSDNIFTAYPKVREKSTSKTVGILEAFEGRNNKNYNWNTFMNQTWQDPLTGKPNLVKDKYEFNKTLIDLNRIPDNYKTEFDNYIFSNLNVDHKSMVIPNLIRFFDEYSLVNLARNINNFSRYYTTIYKK